VRSVCREQGVMTLTDDSTKPMLTIRYVVENDTFVVVDTMQDDKVAATLNDSPRRCTQSVALSRRPTRRLEGFDCKQKAIKVGIPCV
jgi:hypothetical protein